MLFVIYLVQLCSKESICPLLNYNLSLHPSSVFCDEPNTLTWDVFILRAESCSVYAFVSEYWKRQRISVLVFPGCFVPVWFVYWYLLSKQMETVVYSTCQSDLKYVGELWELSENNVLKLRIVNGQTTFCWRFIISQWTLNMKKKKNILE